jgi:hypothetical protein
LELFDRIECVSGIVQFTMIPVIQIGD